MPTTRSHGFEIHFESLGEESGVPIVLVAGGGAQLIWWEDDFCRLLLDHGFRVIRLDNRDVGLSGRSGHDGNPENYTLSDMGDDVIAVLDALGVDRAHVVGESMGGMIGQIVAIEHPDRVASITLFYTAPRMDGYLIGGAPRRREPAADATREERIAAILEHEHGNDSPGYGDRSAWLEERTRLALDRAGDVEGVQGQGPAIMNSADRLPALERLTLPAAFIHGRDDRTLSWRASVDMAAAIPGAELTIYPGMGHEVTRDLWPAFVGTILRTVGRTS